MKQSKYPRIGSTSKLSHPRHVCQLCVQLKADLRVDVQLDPFRGNDEVFYVHQTCWDNTPREARLNRLFDVSP